MSSKLSLCLIVKPSDDEAVLLDRALSYVHKYVDEICITQAGIEPNKKVSEIIDKYKGKESFFKWVHDFSKARNFNFSQATGDYIFWIDSDDVVRGAEHLQTVVDKMETEHIDSVVMNYLYDFYKAEGKNVCTVKHLKTRIIKKGVAEWVGEIHEDFQALRQLNPFFCEEIEILHLTDEVRAKQSSDRNIEIAQKFKENHPDDPRAEWLLANAHQAENKHDEALEFYKRFVKISGSEEERFIAYLRMGDISKDIEYYLRALSIRPDYPDAYLKIGELYHNENKNDLARRFILLGLQIRVPAREIVVYNPRDYDFNPLLTLAKIYFSLKEFKKAIMVLERCEKIIPGHPQSSGMLKMMNQLKEQEDKIDRLSEDVVKEKDIEKAKQLIESAPNNLKSHPKYAVLRNLYFTKTESTGKDIAYYCSYTDEVWYPGSKKIGGSEEAVINLAKQWQKAGWNVTVFNNCGYEPKEYDGVLYRPYWEYNPKDKYDHLIIWRNPRPAEFDHGSTNIYVDVHDVLGKGEFTDDRIKRIKKIFFKTKAHRELYPQVPEEKCAVVPNGIDPGEFHGGVERKPHLILNTSSPDRHLDATLDAFEELIKRDPGRPWKLAWYYGWHNYLAWNKDNPDLMDFYEKQKARFDKLVAEGRAEGGMMIPQSEIAKKYLEAGIFFYPTQFFEIHCISAAKAQAAGCYVVTSDFAALNETVQYGVKVHTVGDKWKTSATFGDTENKLTYVNTIIELVNNWDSAQMEIAGEREWAVNTYNWEKIANQWLGEFQL